MSATGFIEQVPQYSLTHLDDGKEERISLSVNLPGIESASDIDVRIQDRRVTVHVPGKYRLELNLDVAVHDKADSLKFIRKTCVLKAKLIPLPPGQTPQTAAAAPSAESGSKPEAIGTQFGSTPGSQPAQQQQSGRKDPENHDAGSGPGSSSAAAAPSTKSSESAPGSDSAPSSTTSKPGRSSFTFTFNTVPHHAPGEKPSQAAANGHANGSSSSSAHGGSSANGGSSSAGAGAGAQAAGAGAGDGGKAHKHQRHPGPGRAGTQEPQQEQLYQTAKQMANREAAEECAQRARAALRAADPAKAVKLLQRATNLCPGRFEAELQEAEAALASGPQPAAGASGGGPGMERSYSQASSSSAGPEVGAKQAGSGSGSGAGPAGAGSASESNRERASQPYSFKPQFARETTRPDAGSAGPSSTDKPGSGSARPQTAGKGGSSHGQQQHTSYSNSTEDASSSSAGRQHQQQHARGPKGRSHAAHDAGEEKGREREREEAQKESGQAGGKAEREVPAGYAPFKKAIDSVADLSEGIMEAANELHPIVGIVALVVAKPLQLLLFVALTALMLCPHVLPMALALLRLNRAADMVMQLLNNSVAGRAVLTAPTAAACFWLLWWALRAALGVLGWALGLGPVRWAGAAVWWPVTALLLEPNLLAELAATVALFLTDPTKPPAWRYLLHMCWPVPLMLYGAGVGKWPLICLATFLLMRMLARSSVLSACAALAAVTCARSLAWYKAIPSILVVTVVWVLCLMIMESVAEAAGGDEAEGAGSGGRGSRSGADGGSSWWGGGGGKAGAKLKNEAPKGATGEVARVLRAKDYYEVLELPRNADDDAIRKAKRLKSLATHPDKVGQGAPGAKEAFQRVTTAYDILGDPAKRKAYDSELKAQEAQAAGGGSGGGGGSAGAGGAGGGGAGPGSDDGRPVSVVVPCRSCRAGSHEGAPTDIPMSRGRYCARCRSYHPLKHGVGWVDGGHGLFGTRRFYMCAYGRVYDLTEWARCNDLFVNPDGSPVESNPHSVYYSFDKDADTQGGSGSSGGRGSARAGGASGGGGPKGQQQGGHPRGHPASRKAGKRR